MSRAMIRRLAIYSCVAPLEAALQSSGLWQRLIIFAALPSWVDALYTRVYLCLGRSISRENDTKEVDSTGAVHAILQGRTVDFSGPIPLSVDDFGPPPGVVLGNPPQSLTLKASRKSAAIRIWIIRVIHHLLLRHHVSSNISLDMMCEVVYFIPVQD